MLLSNNAISTYFDCQAKFKHQYILRTSQDIDYKIDEKNFWYGTIVHKLAEIISTDVVKDPKYSLTFDMFLNILEDILASNKDYFMFNCEEYIAKFFVNALCIEDAYKNKLKGITSIKTEVKLKNYSLIDAYITTENEQWILDYKTCSSFDENKVVSLHNNFQLNFYAGTCELPVSHIIHLELVKSSHKFIDKDTDVHTFVERILASRKNISSFYRIIKCKYNPDYINYIKHVIKLIHETKDYVCNFNNCVNNYGQPCKFFSSCNGNLFTEKINEVIS